MAKRENAHFFFPTRFVPCNKPKPSFNTQFADSLIPSSKTEKKKIPWYRGNKAIMDLYCTLWNFQSQVFRAHDSCTFFTNLTLKAHDYRTTKSMLMSTAISLFDSVHLDRTFLE